MFAQYRLAILFFALFIQPRDTLAQSRATDSDSVSTIFAKFIRADTARSIILLTNRDIYAAGERIWFKAYIVNTADGTLDVATKNLFADIVDEKDSVIEQVVLDNAGFRTDGAFKIPELLPTGVYWIRCYAASYLNNNKSAIFIHPVLIMNTQLHDESLYFRKFQSSLAKNNNLRPVIQFFPERLTGIPGIISTGVIQMQDANGSPLSAKGELVDKNDSSITGFKTNSFGLARLTFVNDPTETYTAIFYLNNDTAKYQLPSVNKTAIQLSVTNQIAKTVKAFVTLEDSLVADTHTTILAVQRDSLYYAAVGTGNYGITIPIDNLPGGIVRLLLFDGNRELVSERKIYLPRETVRLQIKPDKNKYAARENVNVHVKVIAANGDPVVSVLNVAVEDESVQQLSDSMESGNLPPSNEFLLESWLNRYYTNYSTDDIDLLMVTRKSTSPHSVDGGFTDEMQSFDDDKKLENLTGKIINKKGTGISGRIVTGFAKNARQFFMDVDTTDQEGRFNLSIPQGFDSLQIALQVTDEHHVQALRDSIKIDSFHFPGRLSTPASLKQQFLAGNIATLAVLRKYHLDSTALFQGQGWLKPLTVTTVKKEQLNYDASRRLNSISQILTSDKFRYGGYNAIGNAILTVPGVTISFGDISIFGPNINFMGHMGHPLVVMDGYEIPQGIVVNVLDFLNSLNPADIDFIEVLRGGEAAEFGVRGANGVISINTRHGVSNTDFGSSNLITYVPVTYHVSPAFQIPDYSNKEVKNTITPDPRTTIFWNGNIVTNTAGEANVNFYTADNVAHYVITVTGLTESGELIYNRVVIGNTGKKQ